MRTILSCYSSVGLRMCLLLCLSLTPPALCLQDDKLGRMLTGSLSQHYDAVIGSLPKALSEDERVRIRQSAPMSPAVGSLSKLPQVRISGPTQQRKEYYITFICSMLSEVDRCSVSNCFTADVKQWMATWHVCYPAAYASMSSVCGRYHALTQHQQQTVLLAGQSWSS